MHRHLLILIVAALAAVPTFSQRRTEAEAREIAEALLSGGSKTVATMSANETASSRSLTPVSLSAMALCSEASATESSTQPFYVYNTNPGFVIISGDERTPVVLGWSDDGGIDTDNMPPAFKSLMRSYANTISTLPEVSGNAKATTAKRAMASATPSHSSAISPMLENYNINWGQSDGDYSFPQSGSGSIVSGCVATAVAQVMYYWYCKNGYAPQSTTIPAYTTTTNKTYLDALSPKTFSWSSMKGNRRTGSSGSWYSSQYTYYPGTQYASELMEYFGRAVHMDYGTSGGSNSWIAEIPYSLRTYFGYDKGVHLLYRTDFTAAEWDNIIYGELQAGRPVVYGGATTNIKYNDSEGHGDSEDYGHCYVVDGYATSTSSSSGWSSRTYSGDYYHFNWGWNKSSDGYFLLNNQLSNEFDLYQDAVVGFQPPQDDTTPYTDPTPLCYHIDDMTFSGPSEYSRANRFDDFTGVNIYNAVYNRIDEPSSMEGRAIYPDFDFALGLYDSSDNLIQVLAPRHYGETLIGDGWGEQFCFNGLRFGAELPYGDYKIMAISRVHGNAEWAKDYGADRHYITATISEKALTLTPSAYLTYQNGSFVNNGSQETSSNMYFWTDTYYYRNGLNNTMSGVLTSVAAGGSQTASSLASYGYEDMSSFNYITSDRQAKNFLYRESTSNAWVALSDSIANHFDDVYTPMGSTYDDTEYRKQISGTLVGNDLNVKVTLANKNSSRYSGTITATLTGKTSQSKTVAAAAESSVDASFSFSDLTYGQSYTLTLTAGHESVDTTFTPKRGIVIGYGDGSRSYILDDNDMNIADSAVWVDARYTANASAITPSENANCIYVLADGASIPNNLGDCNVVVGSTAESISLSDNRYGFDTPIAFTAENISYKRTFSKGYDGSNTNWSTLVLPFSATSVMGDNYRGWFTSSNDKAKNVWLMEFSRESGNKVYFRYVNGSTLEANKPYIITVAADAWGDSWNLVGKELTFSGTNATISPRGRSITTHDTHDFIGRSYNLPRRYIYQLNEAGTKFEQRDYNPSFSAFRAYFLYFPATDTKAKAMRIAIDNGTATGIESLAAPVNMGNGTKWYDLEGRRLNGEPRENGVYIHGNRKVIVNKQ